MSAAGPSGSGTVALKVSGSLSGCVLVPSLASTVGQLRHEAARLLDVQDPRTIKVICSGRILQDDTKTLQELNITTRSRFIITRGASAATQLNAQEAQAQRLQHLRAAADKLASRDGRGLTDRYELVLENQDGSALQLAESDRKALVMGLSLHSKGRSSMKRGGYKDALQELLLAEEAFSVADEKLLQGIDNYPMLLLDIVWCCYKLQDAGRLATCQERLRKARKGLQAAHGASMERVRKLHGGTSPEVATYVRLETLEGLVAYHMQEVGAARSSLTAALGKWQKLQVSDDDLAALSAMGYKLRDSKRALRFCAGNVAAATEFLAAEQQRKQQHKEARRQLRSWNRERLGYGRTASGKYVDGEMLGRLCQLGYDRALSAEALRSAENDFNAALDSLVDEQKKVMLLLTMVAQSMEKEHYYGPQQVEQRHVEELLAQGYREYYVRHALHKCEGDYARALRALRDWGDMTLQHAGAAAAAGGAAGSAAAAAAAQQQQLPDAPPPEPEDAVAADAGAAGAAGGGAAMEVDEEDDELERELVGHVQEDPLAAYDVDVGEEGELIQELLASIEVLEQQMQS